MGHNGYRVQLLAPAKAGRLVSGTVISDDADLYRHLLSSLQRLRADSYLEDGAIEPWQIDDQGRFSMEGDESSWHFLLMDGQDEPIACLRLLLHSNTVRFEQLRLTHASIANDPFWSVKLRAAVEADLAEARRAGIGYAELGGWAIAADHRCTKAALETLLASYAWGQMIGGCLSSCTATVRHRSAMILRRIGGQSLSFDGEVIPAYTDPQYGCLMEVLRFDSRVVDSRFAQLVGQMRERLESSIVIREARSVSEEVSAEFSFGQSLLALGAATRRQAPRLDPARLLSQSDVLRLT
jgi:hypothetical protein